MARHLGQAVTLASARGAAGFAGAGWWKALSDLMAAEFPDVAFVAVLDCGDASGRVLSAVRAGCTDIAFAGPDDVRTKLADIAAQAGARLHLPIESPLSIRGVRRSRDAVTAWLTGAHSGV